MKKMPILFLVVLLLISTNVFTLSLYFTWEKRTQNSFIKIANNCTHEVNAYRLNFKRSIQFNGAFLENIALKDSLGNIEFIEDLIGRNNGKILVCRFSQNYCNSCVESAIELFRKWTASFGIKRILYLGNHRNNTILQQEILLYGIPAVNVYNISSLRNPVEDVGYPYYFLLDSDMQISNVFFPDKATPQITKDYLKYIAEFCQL